MPPAALQDLISGAAEAAAGAVVPTAPARDLAKEVQGSYIAEYEAFLTGSDKAQVAAWAEANLDVPTAIAADHNDCPKHAFMFLKDKVAQMEMANASYATA
eukprot:6273296-Pyramimonas_sp.AAC.1